MIIRLKGGSQAYPVNRGRSPWAAKAFFSGTVEPLSDDLLENVLKRFGKEVRVQKSILHQNIVPIVHFDLAADPPYYLMPVADSNLAREVVKDKTLDGQFVAALSDIVAALEEMHSMQIFHRDLKPQNVLRFTSGAGADAQRYYAVSDFGLISMKESQLSALTSTGMARQSDYYTAPEITKDLRFASVQSDIYSLGCILHDMVGLEDRIPCGEIREGGEFGAILLGCTRKDPKQRFKSAKAVLDAVLSVDSASYPAPTQKSIDFIAMLDSPTPPDNAGWKSLADFLDYEAGDNDKRAICLKLGADRIAHVCDNAPEEANRICAAVADGLGGMGGGSYASQLAIRLLKQDLVANDPSEASMISLAQAIHESILEAQNTDPMLKSMATTLTAISLANDHLTGVHCGDTRASLARGRGIKRLTVDQAEGERLYKAGKLTKDELFDYPRKHILDSALGMHKAPQIEGFSFAVQTGDKIFLTSDGVHQKILLQEMLEISNRHVDPQMFVEDVGALIERRKADDNYSIVAIFIS